MPTVVSIVWLNILIVLFLVRFAWSAGCWVFSAIVGAIRRPRA